MIEIGQNLKELLELIVGGVIILGFFYLLLRS